MKQRHLVTNDCGEGALWAFVFAESTDEIRRRHPDLVIRRRGAGLDAG
jgi:hypothetical protein